MATALHIDHKLRGRTALPVGRVLSIKSCQVPDFISGLFPGWCGTKLAQVIMVASMNKLALAALTCLASSVQAQYGSFTNGTNSTVNANSSLVGAIYKDASQPVEARVQDLLARMTIEEKMAQLMQGDISNWINTTSGVFNMSGLVANMEMKAGQFYVGYVASSPLD